MRRLKNIVQFVQFQGYVCFALHCRFCCYLLFVGVSYCCFTVYRAATNTVRTLLREQSILLCSLMFMKFTENRTGTALGLIFDVDFRNVDCRTIIESQ